MMMDSEAARDKRRTAGKPLRLRPRAKERAGLQEERDERREERAAREEALIARAEERDAAGSWRAVAELLAAGESASALLGKEELSDCTFARRGAKDSTEVLPAHAAVLHAAVPLRQELLAARAAGKHRIIAVSLSSTSYALVLRAAYGWRRAQARELADFSANEVLEACAEVAAWGWRWLALELWSAAGSILLFYDKRVAVLARFVRVGHTHALPMPCWCWELSLKCAPALSGGALLYLLDAHVSSAARLAREHRRSERPDRPKDMRKRHTLFVDAALELWRSSTEARATSEVELMLVDAWEVAHVASDSGDETA